MMVRAYSTSDIAEWLGIKRQQVNYYIKAGYLKAERTGKSYIITFDDYVEFKDNYFIPEQFNKQRGPKTLTEKALKLLKDVVRDLEDESIDLDEFQKKHPDLYLLPHPKMYLRYKRDKMIETDREKGFSKKQLSEKYNLSIIRIEEILKKEVEYI